MEFPVTALVPCRSGSQRVPNKNTRPFGPSSESLLEIKLRQLSSLSFVEKIVVTTNDPECVRIAESIGLDNLEIDIRPEELCQDNTPLRELIVYMGTLCTTDDFLWTHVTSPFFGPSQYKEAYGKFIELGRNHDSSLIAVERIQDFVYFEKRPLNFGLPTGFWPRTQDLTPIYRVTSSLFLGSSKMLIDSGNRVSDSPHFYEVTGFAAVDIDWPTDFESASTQMRNNAELCS